MQIFYRRQTMLQKLQTRVTRARSIILAFYRKYERFFPIIFFLGGFLYDSLTLTRIDRLWDNLILLGYIFLAGLLILLIGLIQTGQVRRRRLLQYAKWYPNILQFLLGGLFSAYVIFYFKSAAINRSLIFVALLFSLLVLNEFLHHKLQNIVFLCTVYFFAVFAFLTFFIPVVSHQMSQAMFYSSGAIAFVATALIVTGIYRHIFRQYPKRMLNTTSPILAIFGIMIYLYATNWIPPVPLALKAGGIYHHVHKQGKSYHLKFYRRHRYQFWVRSDKNFQYMPGDTVFCFASVFAPFEMQATIYHRWQLYDPKKDEYITTDYLHYRISGGRKGGYRGYTYKRHIQPGHWRVDVETATGQVLGRIGFTLQQGSGNRGQELTLQR
ncbi:MAG: DUF2914 domain-containing protein [Calditrichaeota bacterium]|nr:MAG: DUF2914 domain-containing protein [Calditrichota bacterium]